MKKRINNDRWQKGVILPTLMISTIVVLAIVLVIAQTIVDNYKTVLDEQYRVNAQFTVDAGVDFAITQLNQDSSWTGVTETDLYDNGEFRTTYEASITDLPNSNKELVVTAKTYAPNTATEPRTSKSVTVELYSLSGGGTGASVVSGAGGLIMENSSKIVAGDVYINGEISMDNTAQIGTTTNAVNVRAAHQSCPVPADATYPQVCAPAENGEPITINNSAHIYGDVQGTNQTTGSGMSNPGLQPGAPAPQALPTHDRNAQKAAATNTMSASAASCTSNGGSLTIPANTRVTSGTVTWRRTCDVTIEGDLWIEGNLIFRNRAELIVSESLGATAPNIMIDGVDGLEMRNRADVVANSFGTGVQFITYYSTASCSPDCADVTGTDLESSRDVVTLELNNSAQGPETIFYARWSRVDVINSGDLGAIVGQTIRLRNSATITFGASVPGFTDPVVWLVHSYRQS